MRIKIIYLNLSLLVFSTAIVSGMSPKEAYRPFAVGPQHPLYFSAPLYSPDSAFTVGQFNSRAEFSYYHINFFGKSINVGQDGPINDSPVQFKPCQGLYEELPEFEWNCKSQGYSILQDGEYLRRTFNFQYGLLESMDVQFIYRDIFFRGGELDQIIESFHDSIEISNAGRKDYAQNQFGIYLWDNKQQELIYNFSKPDPGYQHESKTLAIKLNLLDSESFGLAFKLASSYGDSYLHNLNQVETYKQSSNDFEDLLVSLDTSYLGNAWAFHLAYAQTLLKVPIFPKSPQTLVFKFVGLVFQISDSTYFMVQDLFYSSLFPKDGRENLHYDLRERTVGFRFAFIEFLNLEIGHVNNITYSANNIDAGGFLKLIFVL
ncbi:DUF3187 family protein [Deltaproteobacteria bacterium TL4]